MESIVWIGKHGLNPVGGVTPCFPNASLGMTTVYDPGYPAREYVLRMPANYWGMPYAFLEWMQVRMCYEVGNDDLNQGSETVEHLRVKCLISQIKTFRLKQSR